MPDGVAASINLTKSSVRMDEVRFWRREEVGPTGPVTKWHATAGYQVVTAEGEEWGRELMVELAGADVTTAQKLLNSMIAKAQVKEGL